MSAEQRTNEVPGDRMTTQAGHVPNAAEQRKDRRFKHPGSFVRVSCKSFEVMGAVAAVERQGLLGMFQRLSGALSEVVNLSKGGLAFETTRRFAPGQRLTITLHLPDVQEPLVLTGEVRWSERPRYGRHRVVGVRFDPFSARAGYNPPAALEVLRALEARYAD